MARAGLRISEQHLAEMRALMAAQPDVEVCGLLAGREGASTRVFAITNDLHSATRYAMNLSEQVDAFIEIETSGEELLAIYHSHPHGPARPSATDLAEAHYPGVAHLIWSPLDNDWVCKAFLLDGDEIVDLEYECLSAAHPASPLGEPTCSH
jgi:proteasome lid subunit RPN8/RPN11